MAVEWGVNCKRGGDLHGFYPEDLMIKPDLSGRHDPLTEEQFEELIESIADKGQLEPVLVRREAKMPIVIAGVNRTLAIGEINRRKLKKEPMRVNCVYVQCNEFEAYLIAWDENHKRAPTTAMDDAVHFNNLRKFWSLEVSEIAAKLKVTTGFVKSRLALIEVEPEVQKAVASGLVPATQAVKIKEMTAEQQRALVKQNGKKKITAKDVAKVTGQVVKPSFRAVHEYVEPHTGPGEDESVREFCKGLLEFMDGKG